ncbi:MAG: N-acetyltransferase [Anaerolineae bacterium]|nr:N-acetyltransferase [Anaerolineae bacterium]
MLKAQTPNGVNLRAATLADAPAITAIYAYQVKTGTASWELTPPNLDEVRNRMRAILDAGYPHIVAEVDGVVLGYSYASSYRPRPGYRFTCENSVYVDPSQQRKGIAKLLLSELIVRCAAQGLRQMIAVIGDSDNIASIKLHESVGFVRVGLLPNIGFKFDRWLDSVLMQRALTPGPSPVRTGEGSADLLSREF